MTAKKKQKEKQTEVKNYYRIKSYCSSDGNPFHKMEDRKKSHQHQSRIDHRRAAVCAAMKRESLCHMQLIPPIQFCQRIGRGRDGDAGDALIRTPSEKRKGGKKTRDTPSFFF